MFINTLYQRAVADHCLEVDLWKDYLTYLVRVCELMSEYVRSVVRNINVQCTCTCKYSRLPYIGKFLRQLIYTYFTTFCYLRKLSSQKRTSSARINTLYQLCGRTYLMRVMSEYV